MKKLSKLMCLLLAVGMLMGIASCSSDAGEGGGGSSGGTETVRISCGPLNGYQNVLYNSIADMMNKATPGKYSFAIEASTGSAENARLLAMDETDFGTMGMDMTLSCYNAEGEFEGLPAEQIMHVATTPAPARRSTLSLLRSPILTAFPTWPAPNSVSLPA